MSDTLRPILKGEKTLQKWPVSKIKTDTQQPRSEFDRQRFDDLVGSMAAVGQLAPVIDYPDPIEPKILILVNAVQSEPHRGSLVKAACQNCFGARGTPGTCAIAVVADTRHLQCA